MLIEIIIVLIIGIIIGTLTGLTPGIHTNLIGAIIISLSTGFLLNVPQVYLIVLVTSMAITHTFIDFIPSIFLGCPDTDTELSILPGHELLKEGHGYQAIMLANKGSIAAIFVVIILAIPFGLFLDKYYDPISQLIPLILIITSLSLISSESKKGKASLVFILTGILGYIVLNFPENAINQPLLPLLTGLFGSSSIILSIKNKTKIPPQKIENPKVKILRPLIGSAIASPLCSLLPGLGSGQAAIIGQTISNPKRNRDKKEFLFLLGATNTIVMGFSFLSLYFISKTRTGAASAIKEIVGQTLQTKYIILIIVVILISGIISYYITKLLAKKASKLIPKINYARISYIILGIITLITISVSKLPGLFILIISTLTGIYCIETKVRRTNMMGCLLIPVILFYLF